MKIFLSALENQSTNKGEKYKTIAESIIDNGVRMKYNLMSFYYIQKRTELAELIRDNTDEILIDSGAHSFQKGKKVDWLEYTKSYAEFIKKFDRSNVIGYFEMDVDNIIGYDNVLKLRHILEQVTDKIIPVWHPNRGIAEFTNMCKEHAGRIVAITGFRNMEIKDEQYAIFVKEAHKYGCKIHCLGMTRTKVLDKVPFDYTDSSSWCSYVRFGAIGDTKVPKSISKDRTYTYTLGYMEGMKMQKRYYEKWRRECKD